MTEDPDTFPCDMCGRPFDTVGYTVMVAPSYIVHVYCMVRRDMEGTFDFDATRQKIEQGPPRMQ